MSRYKVQTIEPNRATYEVEAASVITGPSMVNFYDEQEALVAAFVGWAAVTRMAETQVVR